MKLKEYFNKDRLPLRKKVDFLELKIENMPYELKVAPVPNIKKKEETLDLLLNSNLSMARFGDAEFGVMRAMEAGFFQNTTPVLAEKLCKILKSDNENVIVGINYMFCSINELKEKNQLWWLKYLKRNRYDIYKYLDLNKQYYDSMITRPYMAYKDKSNIGEYFNKMQQLWQDKNIVIVEGEKSRLGVGNDLFDNAKSLKRILCPATNAFDKYNEIFEACKKQDKDVLFLTALGSTATVLSYELAEAGFRAIDVGHVDIEYEWFLNKSKSKVVVKNKYVNENKNGRDVGDCTDKKYLESIIETII
jgi:glycosyltransferase family protein